ncbi:hypothetical protein MMC28_010312 [Mycoblastus sanguinarius]|nr:hypothetical protein [Mycoblastus sanguinarius]
MIFRGGQSVVRPSQLRFPCLGSRNTALGFSSIERVPALPNLLLSQRIPDHGFKSTFVTPLIYRTYAAKPVSRPKAHTGRTTTAARKAPTTSKTKAAKKPVAQKTSPKARPKAKSTGKPRIKPKPRPGKKPTAKPKSKKKALTDTQKDALKIKELKVKALVPPHGSHTTAWGVFMAEHAKIPGNGGPKIASSSKVASGKFKELTPERLEHYNHIANQNKAAKAAAYRQWIESHTPIVIYAANLARAALKKRGVKGFLKLQDDRLVRGRANIYAYFLKERFDSGDFRGLKLPEAARLVAREWKALSASEKKPFEDLSAKDGVRYFQELKTVYDKDPSKKA